MSLKHTRSISAGIVFFAIVILLFSCKRKAAEESVTEQTKAVEYPMMLLPEQLVTFLSDQTTLHPVSEEFLNNFLQRVSEYNGTHVQTNVPFPKEWGVVCVEPLPEGRELWLMQSQNREWMYVVITSGLGTQRILDMIPVAVNLVIQDQDILETEVWNTTREADGSFTVEKNYEWIKSVAEVSKAKIDSNRAEYQRSSNVIDKYFINEMSRFEFVPKQDTANYSAIVFYYDAEIKPEEWDDYIPVIQAYCEEKNIFFEEIHSGYNNITVRDFRMNEVATLDITPHIGISDAGMIMFKTGQAPRGVSFGSVEKMKIEIKRYFNLLNQ